MEWQENSGNWVLIPSQPKAVIHFLGGAFVATAPHVTYRWLLEILANQGYAVIATPFVNTLDHLAMAKNVLSSFENCLNHLYASRILRKKSLPIYGIGHSMGCKLHLLIGSLFSVKRAGNILISFNNFAARDAIPLVEQISSVVKVEFTPSPKITNSLIQKRYRIRRNLLIKFNDDNIDQTLRLSDILRLRFPSMVTVHRLKGNHLTPLGQDLSWSVGQVYTPVDAIGQWLKQEVYRDLNQLKREILLWLNPLAPIS
ncbi:MAG: DUF1350 domain-containing protein [Okeania sp. SIO2F4]|uniref:DUF1350 family protein n=1 Tax=Okeania sp. SIO2F4 TaxID=2607790 RepID=UPI00142B7395|nr:DUF1350 family protein [Okeania sp. SIO2F4]NES04425.1 DUF1350 domain-containing protein [Okeania sp. SIO2F4]